MLRWKFPGWNARDLKVVVQKTTYEGLKVSGSLARVKSSRSRETADEQGGETSGIVHGRDPYFAELASPFSPTRFGINQIWNVRSAVSTCSSHLAGPKFNCVLQPNNQKPSRVGPCTGSDDTFKLDYLWAWW